MALGLLKKRCCGCGSEKPHSEFGKKRQGLMARCKACIQIKNAEWYARNSDAGKARSKLWRDANKGRRSEAFRAWAAQNKAHIKDWGLRYRATNRDRINAKAKAYREANRRVLSQRSVAWSTANPGKHHAIRVRRKAAKLQATPSWTNHRYVGLWYQICREESARTGRVCHVDHIVPLKSPLVCGLHNEFNLQVMYGAANNSKGNRWWPGMPGSELCL